MPDIFDQVGDTAAGGGDVFDQVAPKFDPTSVKLDAYQRAQQAGKAGDMSAHDSDFLAAVANDYKSLVPQVAGAVTKETGDLARAAITDAVDTITGHPGYGGNLLAVLNPLGEELPVDKQLRELARSNPGVATLGKVGQGLAATAPMAAMAGLPAGAQRLIGAAFTAKMMHDTPGIATELGREMGRPEAERDQDKINGLVADAIQTTGFSVLGAVGAASEANHLTTRLGDELAYGGRVGLGNTPGEPAAPILDAEVVQPKGELAAGDVFDRVKPDAGTVDAEIVPRALLPEQSASNDEVVQTPGLPTADLGINESPKVPINPPAADVFDEVAPKSDTGIPVSPAPEPAAAVGQIVKLTKPGVDGPIPIAGTVKQILPDGRLEIKTQQDGYVTVAPSELVDKPAPVAQIPAEANHEQPNSILPIPATNGQQSAGAVQPGENPPRMDVREPAGPVSATPPVGPIAGTLGQQDAGRPAPNGSVAADGNGQLGGVRDRGERAPVPVGRPGVLGQPAGADALPGAAADQKQPVGSQLAAPTVAAGQHYLFHTKPGDIAPTKDGGNVYVVGHYPKRKDALAVLQRYHEAGAPAAKIEPWLKGEKSKSMWAVLLPNVPQSFADMMAEKLKTTPPSGQPPVEKVAPGATVSDVSGQNHALPANQDWIPTGDKAKVRANLDAIKLLKKLEAENRNATPEEKAVLAKYTGWGGLKQVFDEGKAAYRERAPWREEQIKEAANWEKQWGKAYDEVNALLTPEEHAAARESILNAHYTAREVVNGVWSAVQRLGFNRGLALEPSAGVGNFLGLKPADIQARWSAVELDNISGRILGKLYPQAQVHVMGFQDARIPVNSQDLIISNVPFAADGPLDKRYPKFSLHNYFFARALDLVKPGGIVAFITSDSTMDSGASRKARDYMAERADLVGAIRLPNNAFSKNAGTEVTTDIVFLRKRDGTPFEGQPFTRTANVGIGKKQTVDINEYFAAHPEMMLGRMSREGTMYQGDMQALVATPGDLNQKLADAVAKLPPNVMGQTTTAEQIARPVVKAQVGSKVGTLVYQDGGVHLVQGDGTLEKPDWAGAAAKVAQAKRYIELRSLGMAAIAEMNDPNATEAMIAATRAKLNLIYDDYVKRHGPLNGRSSGFLDDDGDFPFALSLEDGSQRIVETVRGGKKTSQRVETWIKSRIFTERTIFPRLAPDRADTVADGLQISQNFAGKVDPDYIAKLTGKPLAAVKQELVTSGAAFENPDGGRWEDRSTYLSGYVKDKLKRARIAAADNPLYLKNVSELEAVQPAPRPINKIGVTLGSTWVPPHVIEQFLKDNLEVQARVSRTAETGNWHVTPIAGQWSERNKTTYGVHGWTGHELVERSLNLKNATVTKPGGEDGKSEVRDPVGSAEAQAKQEQLQAEFKKFVLTTPAVANELAQIYNEQFNGVVRPKFEGPVWAHYPGASADVMLRDHQKACVTRNLRNSTGLFHAVGTGKTFIMTTTAMEARRLGLAKKPMIVVQNATVEQFARSFKRLYPASRLLVPNAKQRDAVNRSKTLSRVATGDWDCVIIPQSFVNMLPDDPQRVTQWITDRIEELEAARIAAAAASGDRSPKAADLVKAIKKLKERLQDLANRKVDNVLTFEQLGVDMLMVDEAHAYKKLEFETQMESIKGLDVGRSQRALSMMFKVRHVQAQNQGRNVVFATGTPVSNTLAEMWNMMRFIRPDVLTHYGIGKFDEFASAFCKTKTSTEMTAGGTWKVVTRFNRFTNGPELGNAWRTVADVVTPEEVNLPGLPALKNGKPTMHVIKLTPRLKAYIGQLREELEAFAAMSGKEKRENSHIPLVVYGKAKKAALDMRMINPSLPDEPGSKLNVAADEVTKAYTDSTPVLGTQMIFADSYQDDPDNPGFNLYEEMKKKLMERGIPDDQIQIMTDKVKDARREMVFDKFREGKLRVLIGSTDRMGVGVDVPQHMVALHHLDAPARPMDVEQRNGRIIRQGNQNAEAELHVYGVENTLDAACYQKLADKQVFTNQAVRGDLPDVDFEDAANETSMTFEEQMAAFSGDKRAMEKVGLETQVRQLEALRGGHYEQVRKAQESIQGLTTRVIPYQEQQVVKATAAAQTYARAFATPNHFALKIGERTVDGRKDVAETLDKVFKHGAELILKHVVEGKLFNHHKAQRQFMVLNGQKITFQANIFVSADAVPTAEDVRVAWNFPETAGGGTVTTGAGFFTSLSAVLERIASRPAQAQETLVKEQRNLRELTGFVKQPFDREAELAGAKTRLAQLMTELEDEGKQASKDAQAKIAERKAGQNNAAASDGEEIQDNMGGGPSRVRPPKPAKPVTVRDLEEPASALMQDINRFRAAVAPQTLGEPARFAADLLRMLSAQMANELARADENLKPFRNSFDRTPVAKSWKYDSTLPLPRNLAFIAAYEGGEAASLGATEAKAAAEFTRQNEDWLARVQALGTGALETVIENYFPHLWANPAQAKQVLAQFLRKNPLMGNKSFLKQRTHELFIHGLAAGLRPIHDNPVDLWLLKRREVERFILGHKFVAGMKAAGYCPFVHVFAKAPEGMSTVNDAAFSKYGPPTVTISEAFDAGMREATLDVLKDLGVPHERLAKIGGEGRWGYARHFAGTSGNESITTKFGGPDWVIWHELGHVLDNRYPELRQMLTATDTMETELRALADLRLDEDPSNHEQRYVRSMPEKMAVVMQAYLHAPAKMAEVAPTIKTAFESFLKAHPELAKINDIRPSLRLGSDTTQQSVGGLVKLGNYYMPDAAARVMNNYLSPGLNPHLWYRTLRETSNFLNGVQLGFSAFHLGFTSLDAAVSRLAIAIKYADAGKPLLAAGKVASIPLSPLTNLLQGRRLRNAVLSGDVADPDLARLVQALEAGGGRIGQDQFWQTQFTRRLMRAFHEGTATGYVRGTLLAPFALFEQSLRPIMEYVVPRQKLGVFCEMAKFEMLRMRGDETPDQVRAIMRKCWDSVDNRMGQVVYDNGYYNRTVKDLALLTFRAFGWQQGKYKEGLGGAYDLAQAAGQPFRGERPEVTHRMAYIIALPLLVGVIGGLVNYLMTGQKPQGRDYFMPRIGGADNNGNDLRVNFPSYMKDVIAYGKHPLTSFGHSLNPLISSVWDLMGNKDFYDVRIRNPDDPIWKQGTEVAEFAGKQFVPFSVAGRQKLKDDAAPAWKQIAPFFGITPAPTRLTMTPAQELAAEITAAAMPKEPRTQEQFEKSQTISQVVKAIKAGNQPQAQDLLRGGLQSGILNDAAAQTILERLQYNPLQFQVHNMTAPAAMRVWRLASSDEQTQLKPIIAAKVINSKTLDPKLAAGYLAELK